MEKAEKRGVRADGANETVTVVAVGSSQVNEAGLRSSESAGSSWRDACNCDCVCGVETECCGMGYVYDEKSVEGYDTLRMCGVSREDVTNTLPLR